jgi:hypothetical protein
MSNLSHNIFLDNELLMKQYVTDPVRDPYFFWSYVCVLGEVFDRIKITSFKWLLTKKDNSPFMYYE